MSACGLFVPQHYEVQPDGTKVRVPDESELSVFVGTWNVGNSAPPGDLSPWLQPGVHDVYAVGAQVSAPVQ
mgnify:CR=1 FL=1